MGEENKRRIDQLLETRKATKKALVIIEKATGSDHMEQIVEDDTEFQDAH